MGRLKDRLRGYRQPEQPEEYYEDEDEYYYPEEDNRQEYVRPELPPQFQREDEDHSPLSILDEIKQKPMPKGTYPTVIQGIPVDLHILEDYMIKISPYNIRTIMRYHNARTIEEIKSYARFGSGMKMNSKTIIWILLAIGMAILGIFFVFMMPGIMNSMQGMV